MLHVSVAFAIVIGFSSLPLLVCAALYCRFQAVVVVAVAVASMVVAVAAVLNKAHTHKTGAVTDPPIAVAQTKPSQAQKPPQTCRTPDLLKYG